MAIALERTGDGPPLVLVHGVGTRGRIWHRVVPELSPSFTVITPDLPGFGESDPLGSGFDLDLVADSLAERLAEAAGGRYDLVGHSLGGAIAAKIASRRPDLVERLVLSAPAGFAPRGRAITEAAALLAEPVIGLRRALALPFLGNPIARRLFLIGVVHDGGRIEPDQARDLLTASRGATRIRDAFRAVAGADLRTDLASITAPLGVIWGDRDLVIDPATVDAILAVTGPVPVETIPDAGHVIQVEKPAEFAAAVRTVLDALTSGRRRSPQAGLI